MSESKFIEISDRYKILDELGQGGMGVVYRAFDKNLAIDVAIKVLKNEPSDKDVVKFQKEAKASARLKHDSIIRVLDFGLTESTGRLYLVMEYVSSESLEDLINKNGSLDLKTALDIFSLVLKGVRHAHENGILHRDLKPSNILLDKTEESEVIAKIVDFGVARILDEDASSTFTTFLGTPYYVAPEMVEGRGVDQRSDIYSLGCVLFKMLSGRVPYSADTIIETLEQHKTGSHGSLSDEVEELKKYPEIEDITSKCLNPEPEERYASVDELLRDVEAVRVKLAKELEESLREKRMQQEDSRAVADALGVRAKGGKWRILIVILTGLIFGGFVIWFSMSVFREKNQEVSELLPVRSDLIDQGKQMETVVDKFTPKFNRRNQFGRNWLFSFTPDLKDDDLKELVPERDVRYIWITDGNLTGTGFKYLKGRKILSLNLMKSTINDDGLAAISQLTSLQRLRIKYRDSITDSGIPVIINLKDLHTLQLSLKQVSDEGLDHILKLPKLVTLSTYAMPKITDRGFLNILKVKRLEYLNIGGTSITDRYFNRLAELKKLRYLDISELKLTDNSLRSYQQ